MSRIKFLSLISLITLACSCKLQSTNRYGILDNYELYRYHSGDPWVLQCNPGCDEDKFENVESVYFSTKQMIVVQNIVDKKSIRLMTGNFICCSGGPNSIVLEYSAYALDSLLVGLRDYEKIPR